MITNLPLIIIGAGGHAMVLVDLITCLNREIYGISSLEPPKQNFWKLFNFRYLGNNEQILSFSPEKYELVNAVGSVKTMTNRARVYNLFKSKGYRFATLIHPKAVVSKFANIGEGTQIMAGSIIQPDAVIGVNCIINTNSSVDHSCIIGNHVHIAPGVAISGDVIVEDEVHIGVGATIKQGVKIGKGATIGAGAVVITDVSPGHVVVGVPAKPIENKK